MKYRIRMDSVAPETDTGSIGPAMERLESVTPITPIEAAGPRDTQGPIRWVEIDASEGKSSVDRTWQAFRELNGKYVRVDEGNGGGSNRREPGDEQERWRARAGC